MHSETLPKLPQQVNPLCSVIVCTRHRPAQLAVCLSALSAQDYPSFEMIVVDNAGTDATKEMAAKWAHVCVEEPIPGLSRARNRGIRESKGEILAFTDDDAIPDPGWLSALMHAFHDPQIMAVTGPVFPAKLETESEKAFHTMGGFFSSPAASERLNRDVPRWFEIVNFGGFGCGANLAIRRIVLEFVPGFDERLGSGAIISGGEDFRMLSAIVEQGHAVAFCPDAIIKHPYPETKEALKMRYLAGAKVSAAYAALLMAEEPKHRMEVLRYVLAVFRGKSRPWWNQEKSKPAICGTLPLLFARVSGLFQYLRLRISG